MTEITQVRRGTTVDALLMTLLRRDVARCVKVVGILANDSDVIPPRPLLAVPDVEVRM